MQLFKNPNRIPDNGQDGSRLLNLRLWKVAHGVSWVDMGRAMGIGGSAAQLSLQRSRMPVDHHAALLAAYPHLPESLLPVPEDVSPGRKPRETKTSAA